MPTTRRQSQTQKNRVAAIRSPSVSSIRSPAGSTASIFSPPSGDESDSISACTGDSRYKSIRPSILKQLAEDIEANGGIGAFIKTDKTAKDQRLCRLLNQDEDTYGKRGDPLRRDLQNKCNYWIKLFQKGRYSEKVLKRYEVLSFEAREALNKQETKKKDSKEDSESLSSSSSSSLSSVEDTKKTAENTTSQEQEKPPVQLKIPKPQLVLYTPKATVMSSSPRKAIPNGAFSIHVDLERPENNREVYVYEVDEIEGVGSYRNKVYKGFYILFQVDVRYPRDDPRNAWYTLKIISPNQVLLKMPGCHYAMQNNEDREQLNKHLPESVSKSIDKKRNDYAKRRNNGEAGFKYLVLTFPECQPGTEIPVELTTTPIYEKATDEQWAKFESFPIPFRKDLSKDLDISSMKCSSCGSYPNVGKEVWGGFALAMKDTAPNQVGAVDDSGESDVAAMIRLRGGLF
jgi:hypothetical protein